MWNILRIELAKSTETKMTYWVVGCLSAFQLGVQFFRGPLSNALAKGTSIWIPHNNYEEVIVGIIGGLIPLLATFYCAIRYPHLLKRRGFFIWMTLVYVVFAWASLMFSGYNVWDFNRITEIHRVENMKSP